MAKTIITRLPSGDKTPFLRGILVRSLVRIGLSFDDAYEFANKIRDDLKDSAEINSADLQKHVGSELEKRFGKHSRQIYEARHQAASDIIVHTRTRSMTFSTGILSHSLEGCAINPKQALIGASKVRAAIRTTGHKEIDHKSLRRLIYRCLRDHCSEDAAERYLAWRRFYNSGIPMIVLIGGATGTGKSTVAAELAYRLDIARTQSTDMMREIIRSYLAPEVSPALQYSSYEAWRGLATPHNASDEASDRIVSGYLAQLTTMKPAIETTIARAIHEKENLVMEGVHIMPTELELEHAQDQAIVLQFMLAVLDKSSLRKRLAKRILDTDATRGTDHHESIDAIWELQSWLLDVADTENIHIISDPEIENSIRDIMELASIEIRKRFPPDPSLLEWEK
jgi:2-phosphoglycerate kinase